MAAGATSCAPPLPPTATEPRAIRYLGPDGTMGFELLKGSDIPNVDVVVGTHRLLSKDVVFQDLGLLIVDEEQRFGVRHKERIKTMRNMVDVLSLHEPAQDTAGSSLSTTASLVLIELKKSLLELINIAFVVDLKNIIASAI